MGRIIFSLHPGILNVSERLSSGIISAWHPDLGIGTFSTRVDEKSCIHVAATESYSRAPTTLSGALFEVLTLWK
jgi:hypothetical protein